MLSVGPALFPKKLFGSVYRIRIGIYKVAEYVSNLDPDPQLGLLVVLCIITYQGAPLHLQFIFLFALRSRPSVVTRTARKFVGRFMMGIQYSFCGTTS